MIGVYDFCGHYEWTFAWLEEAGGEELLKAYWDEAIHRDSQAHAASLIVEKGFAGMQEYWGHSLSQEAAGYSTCATESSFRIDISDCPSKGFLLRNGLQQHHDYCDHCIGWIGPMMGAAGYVVDHQHNHRGQCWWEFRRAGDQGAEAASEAPPSRRDVTRSPQWTSPGSHLDTFLNATDADDKRSKDT